MAMVRTEIRVIYGDTDQMGVVYYANYLRYFEAGRNEFIRAQGLSPTATSRPIRAGVAGGGCPGPLPPAGELR